MPAMFTCIPLTGLFNNISTLVYHFICWIQNIQNTEHILNRCHFTSMHWPANYFWSSSGNNSHCQIALTLNFSHICGQYLFVYHCSITCHVSPRQLTDRYRSWLHTNILSKSVINKNHCTDPQILIYFKIVCMYCLLLLH